MDSIPWKGDRKLEFADEMIYMKQRIRCNIFSRKNSGKKRIIDIYWMLDEFVVFECDLRFIATFARKSD